jgi:predicted RNA polymerase sigma factor
MLLTDARRSARTTPAGALIPLHTQDRSLWDAVLIEEGTRLITAALARRRLGEYQLQAAVAAVHAESLSTEETDWARIAALYALHERTAPNPVVTMNRAIAVAMVAGPQTGPEAGLELLAGLEEQLGDHHRLIAARAHLHELAGRSAVAAELYRQAAARATNQPERDHLTLAAARLAAQSR